MKYYFTVIAVLFLAGVHASGTELKIASLTIEPNSEFDLAVELSNADVAICGAQFDVQLPEGFSFATDEYGDPELTTGRSTKITTEGAIQSDGSLRILAYSSKNYTYSGTSGAIVTVKVKAPVSIDESEYTFCLSNIALSKIANQQVSKITQDDYEYRYKNGNAEDKPTETTGTLLTAEMYHEWNGSGADATITSETTYCEYMINDAAASGGTVYGNGNVAAKAFADVTEYAKLVLTFTEGTPRLLFNRSEDTSSDYIEIKSADSPYVTVGEDGSWTIDITKINEERGFAHLLCIKGANWANVTITKAELIKKEGSEPEKVADIIGIVPITLVADSEFDLAVELTNVDVAICGAQFDVQLPEGFSFVTDEYGDPELTAGRSTKITTEGAIQSDGSLRILAYSSKNYTYSGTSGAIVTIKVKAPVSIDESEYAFRLSNIALSKIANQQVSKITQDDYEYRYQNSDTPNEPAEVHKFSINILSEVGMCYEDISYDATDLLDSISSAIGCTISDAEIYAVQPDWTYDSNYELGTTDGWRNAEGGWSTWGNSETRFTCKANFTNESAQIYYIGSYHEGEHLTEPITYTATYSFKNGNREALLYVNLIYKQEDTPEESTDMLSISSFSIQPNSEFDLAVELTNADVAICGAQFDVQLPEGFCFVTDEYGDPELTAGRSTKITTEGAIQSDGSLRILAYSSKNYTYLGTSGAIVTIKVKAPASLAESEYIFRMSNIALSKIANQQVSKITQDDYEYLLYYEEPISIFRITDDYTIDEENSPSNEPEILVTNDLEGQYTAGHLTIEGTKPVFLGSITTVYDFAADYKYNHDSYEASLARSENVLPTVINTCTGTFVDSLCVLLKLRSNTWNFVTFPIYINVSDIKSTDANAMWSIRRYSGKDRAAGNFSATWQEVESTETLIPGVGYIIMATNYSYANDVWYENETTTLICPYDFHHVEDWITSFFDAKISLSTYASEFAHNSGWNLIGNPYASYYDIRKMSLTAPITVWNPVLQNYEAYSPLDDSYILLPGEAFFIQCPTNVSNVIFPATGRQHTIATTDESGIKSRGEQKNNRDVFNFRLSGETTSDRARLVLNPEISNTYDPSVDAAKFDAMKNDATLLYLIDGGVNYAIDERPYVDNNIMLGYKAGKRGTYTISMQSDNRRMVVLYDHKQEMSFVLSDADYVFTTEAGQYNDRFTLTMPNATEVQTLSEVRKENLGGRSYNLSGQVVDDSYKGVVIKDGKKMLNR